MQPRQTKKHLFQEAMEWEEEVDERLPEHAHADWNMLRDVEGHLAR